MIAFSPSRRHGKGLLVASICTFLLAACSPLRSGDAGWDAGAPHAICSRGAALNNPLAALNGLGGTGAPRGATVDPGGMGGTGQVAQREGLGGTGIVGVITGFASICVNGVEVQFDSSTPVRRDGQESMARELAVGQVVAVLATGNDRDLRASQIAVLDAAFGPVGALDIENARLVVMGQAVVALVPEDLKGLRVGDWARVSGLRHADGEIRASRVRKEKPDHAGEAHVAGPVTQVRSGEIRVGDTPVKLAGQYPLPSIGQEVAVRGTWDGQGLKAGSVTLQPTRAALGAANQVVLQGYVHSLRGRELRLGYETLVLGDRLEVRGGRLDQLQRNQAVQIRGRLDEAHSITVDRLEFRGEGGRGRDGGGRRSDDRRDDREGKDEGRSSNRGKGSDSSGSGSSGSGSSGSGSSGSGSSGSGSSGSGSSGSGKD